MKNMKMARKSAPVALIKFQQQWRQKQHHTNTCFGGALKSGTRAIYQLRESKETLGEGGIFWKLAENVQRRKQTEKVKEYKVSPPPDGRCISRIIVTRFCFRLFLLLVSGFQSVLFGFVYFFSAVWFQESAEKEARLAGLEISRNGRMRWANKPKPLQTRSVFLCTNALKFFRRLRCMTFIWVL